jgi:hypothetical protein
MANAKVPNLAELTTPADDDVLYVVDISDTTDDAAGSSRKIAFSSLSRLPGYTTAEISDIADAVNTSATKVNGVAVWDTTATKIKVATGADNNSTWVDADGTNAITPA